MLTAANALDGRGHTVWQFSRQNTTLAIDLEAEYSINAFLLRDSLESTRGYQIAISNDGSTWETVLDTTYSSQSGTSKIAMLDVPVNTRYVQFSISLELMRGTIKIQEFEVYKEGYDITGLSETTYDDNHRTPLGISPSIVERGTNITLDTVGKVCIYSPQGNLLDEYLLTSRIQTIPTSRCQLGVNLVYVENANETKLGKLIVY